MIVGTAGYIDSGKTSLNCTVTGVDAARLKEEKTRASSIDLGFSYWPRPSGEAVGFVDVPGHEGLVHNMLAGGRGIEFVILVFVPDDGVMPRTRKHLTIVALLGLEFFDRQEFTIRRQDPPRINPARVAFFAPKAVHQVNGGVPLPVGRPDFNSGGAVRRSLVGSTPILLRHLFEVQR